jgi:hypothetical protein
MGISTMNKDFSRPLSKIWSQKRRFEAKHGDIMGYGIQPASTSNIE